MALQNNIVNNFKAVNNAVHDMRLKYRGIEDNLMLFASLDPLDKNDVETVLDELSRVLEGSTNENVHAEMKKAEGFGILKYQ